MNSFERISPAIAPVAMQQGWYVARAILGTISDKKVKPF